jgi:hypothetical protein
MKMNKLNPSVLGAFFLLTISCAKPGEQPTSDGPTQAEADKAVLVAGDLVPVKLFALPVLPGLEKVRLTSSNPGTPKVALQLHPLPETRIFRETILHLPPNSAAGTLSVPIDEAGNTQIFVGPKSDDPATIEAAEHDLAFVSPTGKMVVESRVNKAASALKLAKGALADNVKLNAFRFDPGAPKGDYVLRFGPTAAKTGFALEVRMPDSKLEMDLTPSAHQFVMGQTATVAIKLIDDGKPISGATLEGFLVEPDGDKGRAISFREKGNGEYEALVSNVLDAKSLSGIYNVAVRATGVSNGVKFNRFGMTAMGYVVPTAKIVSATAPRAIDDKGLTVAFETDVVIDVASGDRYEVSAALAAAAPDGTERVVVAAQTAEFLDAGRHTITLRFDAGMAGLAKMDGPYTLRGLDLYSQGRRTMLHHLARGLDLKTAKIALPQLAPITKPTPAIEELDKLGDFDLTK